MFSCSAMSESNCCECWDKFDSANFVQTFEMSWTSGQIRTRTDKTRPENETRPDTHDEFIRAPLSGDVQRLSRAIARRTGAVLFKGAVSRRAHARAT